MSTYVKNLFLYEELPNLVPDGGGACLTAPVWCSFSLLLSSFRHTVSVSIMFLF